MEDWLARFAAACAAGDAAGAATLFTPGAAWRDLLAFTWNIRTAEGRADIAATLAATLPHARPSDFRATGDGWFTFSTATAHALGRVTLQDGLADVLFTMTTDLIGHEEAQGATRPMGVIHRADRNRTTWAEARAERQARIGHQDQPHTLIIGGGQGGIALAARLKSLGVPALVVERNARAGDSWRNRYRSLVLHDPVWYDHLPYLPFPPNWPVFTPKDRMGDWLESYARIFDLDIWQSTSADRATWDGERWTVQVTREGRPVTLTPRHLVFATGAYGPPNVIDWPGQDAFRGRLLHSSAYRDGRDYAGLRCAVIGAASSAHDIATDLWEAGASVTMVQRSPTTVVRSETLMRLAFADYSQEAQDRGLTTDRADLLSASVPQSRAVRGQQALYAAIRDADAAFYDRLTASGFRIDWGEDDSGLMLKALRTASGYYIDVGASDLIARGEIAIASGAGVERLVADGLILTDGRHIAADVVIACTGYRSMHEVVGQIVDAETAAMVGPCWGLGSGVRGDPGPWQGELRNMWKPTAHPALWFHGGNLALSRFYSRILALQLKARFEGLSTPVHGRPADQRGE